MGFVANAFSGLIAWRVFQWEDKPLHNWQYLFVIEGSMTVCLAILSFILLPRSVETSPYFTTHDRKIARQRAAESAHLEYETFAWRSVLRPLSRPETWFYAALSLSYGVACASVSNFLPTMIQRLASGDAITANLYTIAPNLSRAVFIIVECALSDYFRRRAPFLVLSTIVAMLGFVLLGTLNLTSSGMFGAGYACTFLITFGTGTFSTFTSAMLVPAWAAGNVNGHSARATTLGLVAGMQNLGGIVSSLVFRAQDKPVYRPALVTSGVFQGCVVLFAMGGWVWYGRENRRLVKVGEKRRMMV